MSLTQLRTPFLENPVRWTNFFNGRLLSGEDMSTEHAALIERTSRLGQAVGSGVAWGLEVKYKTPPADASAADLANPVLTVNAGLAINPCGQPVKLVKDVDVALVRQPPPPATNGKTFACCESTIVGGRYTGDGVYLFTIAPASGREGRALVNGVSTDAAKCNFKYYVEGVQFNLMPINDPIPAVDVLNQENLSILRNRIAYECFGTDDLIALERAPFDTDLKEYGALDALRKTGSLSNCEVPLAIVYWDSTQGVQFTDLWAVRRRLTRASLATRWPAAAITDRRLSEGEAMLSQFSEHWRDLQAAGLDPLATDARSYFLQLPPVGLLPTAGSTADVTLHLTAFFQSMAFREPVFLAGDKVGQVLSQACLTPPVRLGTQEHVWLYWIRENLGGGTSPSTSPATSGILFTSVHLRYEANARFNADYFNFSNYAFV